MFFDQNNRPYFGDLQPGDREATQEEVAAWELVRLPTVADKLQALDTANALTQRNLRDFILLTTEALKLGQPVDLTQVRGIQAVMAVEAEAAVLRAQL